MTSSRAGTESAPPPGEITALLRRWQGGDSTALDTLVPLVYEELKRVARSYLRGQPADVTLQPTAVVHELFLRLLGRSRSAIADRHHFFALSAKLLRQVLVDQARARAAAKRGGGRPLVDATMIARSSPAPTVDLLDLERALEKLRLRDEQLERLVELRFFGGLTIEESAAILERSAASIGRDWALARAFLQRELRAAPSLKRDSR